MRATAALIALLALLAAPAAAPAKTHPAKHPRRSTHHKPKPKKPKPKPKPKPRHQARAAATGSTILSGQALASGASLTSPGGAYVLTMQRDGDAVLTGPAGVVFHTETSGHPGSSLVQEPGGDLVVTGPEGEPLWITWSPGHPGATTTLTSTGQLIVSDPGGAELFASPAPQQTAAAQTPAAAPATGPCPSTPSTTGTTVTRWRPVVTCVLGMLGQPATDPIVADVLLVIQHESSGVPTAINDWDSNAQRGDPSRGLMQVIDATFAANRSTALANDIYDPAANIYAGLHYAIARYGSIAAIPGVARVNAGGTYVGYLRTSPR